MLSSLSCELNDQAIASDRESLALNLLHDLLRLIGRAESHEAGTLGLALVIHEDIDLAHVKVELLESSLERVTINVCAQVAHIDSLDFSTGLCLVASVR